MTDQLAEKAYPTWEEFGAGEQTETTQLLIQAIALLSGQPAYSHLSPGQVYGKVVSALRVE